MGWAEVGNGHCWQHSLVVLIYAFVTLQWWKATPAWASSEAEQARGIQSSESPWVTKPVCVTSGALNASVTSRHFHLHCFIGS